MLGTAGAAIKPLRQEELKAKRIEGGAVFSEFWARRVDVLLDGVKRLRFGITEEQRGAVGARGLRSDGRAAFLTLEERRDPQWEIALRDFLTVVETKTRDWDESEALHFHKVSFTYIPLIDLAPPGELQDTIVRSFVGFLRRSPVERNSPPEWFMEFTRLVLHGDGTQQGRNRILEEIGRTGDSVMNLYLELDVLAPKQQQQPASPAVSR
jgi:hypothetical protein